MEDESPSVDIFFQKPFCIPRDNNMLAVSITYAGTLLHGGGERDCA